MKIGKKNFKGIMQQAQQMQEQLHLQMSQTRVEASSGGGAVQVVMDGSKQIQSIRIEPEAADPEDIEMLQDLILTAVNEATRKVDETMKSQLGGLTGGLLGPGGF